MYLCLRLVYVAVLGPSCFLIYIKLQFVSQDQFIDNSDTKVLKANTQQVGVMGMAPLPQLPSLHLERCR